MNAENLISEVEREDKNKLGKDGCFALFYPNLYAQKLVDKNISKCMGELK